MLLLTSILLHYIPFLKKDLTKIQYIYDIKLSNNRIFYNLSNIETNIETNNLQKIINEMKK